MTSLLPLSGFPCVAKAQEHTAFLFSSRHYAQWLGVLLSAEDCEFEDDEEPRALRRTDIKSRRSRWAARKSLEDPRSCMCHCQFEILENHDGIQILVLRGSSPRRCSSQGRTSRASAAMGPKSRSCRGSRPKALKVSQVEGASSNHLPLDFIIFRLLHSSK